MVVGSLWLLLLLQLAEAALLCLSPFGDADSHETF